MNDKELDKWFRSHAPQCVALGSERKFNFTDSKDLTGLFRQCSNARTLRSKLSAWKKLQTEFAITPARGKLKRDVEIALLLLSDHKPTIAEIFRMVHQWDKSYTEMGVRKVVQRRKLDVLISPGRRGPKKN